MPLSGSQGGSMLVVEEYFSAGDDRFLGELRKVQNPKSLAGFADRWKRDPRPWARQQIVTYLRLPMDVAGHQPVVKRLFKHFEERGDDELMALMLAAFDRLVRRERQTRWRFDWETRESFSEEMLRTPRNALVSEFTVIDPQTGKKRRIRQQAPRRGGLLFSHKTRYYLRRRTWRYFRRLGFRRPNDYPVAIARALSAYRDEDLNQGEHVLESWGLMQACFRRSPALDFGSTRIGLRAGQTLAGLRPAPQFLSLWKKPESLGVLLLLLTTAQSRLVRQWSMELIRHEHKDNLAALPVEEIMRLLDHENADLQQFGAELLEHSPRLAALPVSDWLKMLKTENLTALALVCAAMKKHVSPDRLSLELCVTLASEKATPVARLGFEFLPNYPNNTPEARAIISRLADAQCNALGKQLATWALGIIATREHYNVDSVSAFFDSLLAEVREGAWEWLVADSAGHDDPVLFARLLETPYDDLRLRLIDDLTRRSKLPGRNVDDLTPVWSSVLLGVHRGGRQKARAAAQLADALVEYPDRAETLLPVLAVAVRSIRAPELRSGLAAVAAVVERRPELTEAVRRHLPEFVLMAEEVAS